MAWGPCVLHSGRQRSGKERERTQQTDTRPDFKIIMVLVGSPWDPPCAPLSEQCPLKIKSTVLSARSMPNFC
jgi:hypothetical protein